MVVVAALLNPAWRIEIEMDAVIPNDASPDVTSDLCIPTRNCT